MVSIITEFILLPSPTSSWSLSDFVSSKLLVGGKHLENRKAAKFNFNPLRFRGTWENFVPLLTYMHKGEPFWLVSDSAAMAAVIERGRERKKP